MPPTEARWRVQDTARDRLEARLPAEALSIGAPSFDGDDYGAGHEKSGRRLQFPDLLPRPPPTSFTTNVLKYQTFWFRRADEICPSRPAKSSSHLAVRHEPANGQCGSIKAQTQSCNGRDVCTG